jgi:hypothetical protein
MPSSGFDWRSLKEENGLFLKILAGESVAARPLRACDASATKLAH